MHEFLVWDEQILNSRADASAKLQHLSILLANVDTMNSIAMFASTNQTADTQISNNVTPPQVLFGACAPAMCVTLDELI